MITTTLGDIFDCKVDKEDPLAVAQGVAQRCDQARERILFEDLLQRRRDVGIHRLQQANACLDENTISDGAGGATSSNPPPEQGPALQYSPNQSS